MPPGPSAQSPLIAPRQPGESEYSYRKRRLVALTGETPYQRRQRLGRARGLGAREAAGHTPTRGQSEYQRRAQLTQERYGMSPYQLWAQNQLTWLQNNGFTPETTGWSQYRLIRIAPRLRWMNKRAAPGGQVRPDMLMDGSDMENSGDLESNWTWERVNERYDAMYEFVEQHNKQLGNFYWFRDQDYRPELEAAWWYYH